jgi:molecular chaperone DnaJ
MELKIPAGTQSGTTLRQKGKGMPQIGSTVRGDLLVTVIVSVPKELNAAQKKKLEEFAELMGDEDVSSGKSFFERIKETFQ